MEMPLPARVLAQVLAGCFVSVFTNGSTLPARVPVLWPAPPFLPAPVPALASTFRNSPFCGRVPGRQGLKKSSPKRETFVAFPDKAFFFGDLKITSTSTERQKRSQNLAPVLLIISGKSLVFSRKIITSTDFYRYCAPDASAPVVVINQSPIFA